MEPASISHHEARREPGPYVYSPPQVPLDVEGYPAAPEDLQLQQIHVYVRHGERTPVGIRLHEPPASIPRYWNMCKTARRFNAAVADLTGNPKTEKGWHGSLSTRRLVERSDGTAVPGECLLGELTDLGRQSTYNYGLALRKLYVDRLKFLPDILDDPQTVYFRSTNMARTMESLQQIMHGLYPNERCQPHAYPHFLVRNGKDENLIGNAYSCKRLEFLLAGFAKSAAENHNGVLQELDSKLSKYINGNPIRLDGRPRASGIMDTIRAAVAHGVKVPPEFEDENVVNVIEHAVTQEWFAGYKTEEVRRLGMGRLLEDLLSKMSRKVNKGDIDPLRLLVYTTHDTGIAGLLSTLDVYDEKWPPFTSSITFELFKQTCSREKASAQGILSAWRPLPVEHYVRMRYQNKNMILPFCLERGKHLEGSPEFCTLKAFRDRVKELTPTDFELECVLGATSSK